MMAVKTFLKKFKNDENGVTAIEMAIGITALFLFSFFIINVGDLAFTEYSINRAVVAAAHYAAVQASDKIGSSGTVTTTTAITSADCPSQSDVQNAFDQAAAPPYSSTDPAPAIQISWWGTMNPCGGTQPAAVPPGGGVTVSVKAAWEPIAAPRLFPIGTITLGATQSLSVMLAPLS